LRTLIDSLSVDLDDIDPLVSATAPNDLSMIEHSGLGSPTTATPAVAAAAATRIDYGRSHGAALKTRRYGWD